MMGITLWTLAAGFDYAAIPIPLKVFFAKVEALGYNNVLSLLAVLYLFRHNEIQIKSYCQSYKRQ